jgi:hypothetical protein
LKGQIVCKDRLIATEQRKRGVVSSLPMASANANKAILGRRDLVLLLLILWAPNAYISATEPRNRHHVDIGCTLG